LRFCRWLVREGGGPAGVNPNICHISVCICVYIEHYNAILAFLQVAGARRRRRCWGELEIYLWLRVHPEFTRNPALVQFWIRQSDETYSHALQVAGARRKRPCWGCSRVFPTAHLTRSSQPRQKLYCRFVYIYMYICMCTI